MRGFPGGPRVTNPPSSAGYVGSIPGQGTKPWGNLDVMEPKKRKKEQ